MPGFYATIARYYDAEHSDQTEDIPFYVALAEDYGGPIIDIGCGTGRVMIPLALEGHEVHGIDSEEAMLVIAEQRRRADPRLRDSLTFHLGDVLTHPLDKRFKLVLVPYNGLMHFHEQEAQLALLKRLRSWTLDDGLLVLDLPNAGDVFASQDTEAIILERTFLEPETGHLVMQQSVSFLDRVEQVMHVTWIYDEVSADGSVKRTIAPIRWYYYFFAELKLLLAAAGFEVEEVYGDLDFGPFVDGCPRMVVLAKPV